jgi:hypothetical protein
MKKNMAVSDIGVACHKNMNMVGRKILGSFTVSQRKPNCELEISKNVITGPLGASRIGKSEPT